MDASPAAIPFSPYRFGIVIAAIALGYPVILYMQGLSQGMTTLRLFCVDDGLPYYCTDPVRPP
jgi:hypothetical protein